MIARPSAASGIVWPPSVLVDGRLWTPATGEVCEPFTTPFGDSWFEPPGSSTIGLTAPTALLFIAETLTHAPDADDPSVPDAGVPEPSARHA